MIEERMNLLIEYGNTLPHASVYFREDWQVYYFDLAGKQFGLMSKEPSEESVITLKGNPDVNEEMRENYSDISPGYYANKKHWNSIKLNSKELSGSEIKRMILTSYELVWGNLPAKIRKELKSK